MISYKVTGNIPLQGTITPSGNKNAALPILAACLLTDKEVILENIPKIRDVRVQLRILRKLGAQIRYSKDGKLHIRVKKLKTYKLTKDDVSKSRGSVLFLGPLIARAGKVTFWAPGGCKLGKRPIDNYFFALKKLGAKLNFTDKYEVSASSLKGAQIWQEETSVTGTENLIMAAVMAQGKTKIINAASEPHVCDLCNFLSKMGARISGIGTNTLEIEGVNSLGGCEFRISDDYMEIGTFIIAAAVTKGEVHIKTDIQQNLDKILMELAKLGIKVKVNQNGITVPENQHLVIQNYLDGTMNKIECLPWPGFPADLMQLAIVAATQAKGKILIFDKMYEGRLFFTSELNMMKADIVMCDPHRVIVHGRTPLKGASLQSPDIRAGAALLVASLCAEGESVIHNGEIIERGYENIDNKLQSLGAKISKVRK